MDFNQFVDEVKGRIKQFLPIEYEDAQVKIEEIKKLNENYLGITVLKENQVIAPTFNLNQLYEMYPVRSTEFYGKHFEKYYGTGA